MRYLGITKGIRELESFATLNKVPGRPLYRADVWFVVRAAPGVAMIETATPGVSHSTSVRDGFAFIHIKETADVRGKFVYGLAAGYGANGGFLGSTILN